MTSAELLETLNRLYSSNPWPRPFSFLRAPGLAETVGIPAAARELGTTKKKIEQFVAAKDLVTTTFGNESPSAKSQKAARQMLGNLILGRCAERVFVDRYKSEAATTELALSDLRDSGSDTDYRLMNGKGRPVYRINIKFVGSVFRRARELVGLDPEDCFPLATYKIRSALEKQQADELPFLFIVVAVPGLPAEAVGSGAEPLLQEFLSLVTHAQGIPKKRAVQDAVVDLLERTNDQHFMQTLARIEHGEWYVLSARRADRLLREKLFDRVYALRIRGFAQQFRGAELDMHFSLAQDLTPLSRYLQTLREAGYPKVTTLLERGDY